MQLETIRVAIASGQTAGENTSDVLLQGFVDTIKVVTTGAPSGTMDITITEVNGLGQTILVKSNVDDGTAWFSPRGTTQKASDGSAISDQYQSLYICSKVKVALAQGDDDTVVTVSIQTRDF